MEETISMSIREIDRLCVLNQVIQGQMTQLKAAKLLKITDRQIRNLIYSLKKQGPEGLISKKRGRPSNRKKDQAFKNRILKIIAEKYPNFGPTLCQEKLLETYKIKVGIETLRLWMIDNHLWIPRKKKQKFHPTRKRRERCLKSNNCQTKSWLGHLKLLSTFHNQRESGGNQQQN